MKNFFQKYGKAKETAIYIGIVVGVGLMIYFFQKMTGINLGICPFILPMCK